MELASVSNSEEQDAIFDLIVDFAFGQGNRQQDFWIGMSMDEVRYRCDSLSLAVVCLVKFSRDHHRLQEDAK